MKISNMLLGVVAIGLAGTALAGEDVQMKMAIEVVADDSSDGTHFMINSDTLDFDLHEMQEGETRSIVDESGRSILITRQADGFAFNVDGKIIELPGFTGEEHNRMVWMADGERSDVDVHVMHDTKIRTMHDMDQTMILSPKPIDEATQQAIKSLLESAGYGSEVDFVDRSEGHDRKIMIRKVERTVESPQT